MYDCRKVLYLECISNKVSQCHRLPAIQSQVVPEISERQQLCDYEHLAPRLRTDAVQLDNARMRPQVNHEVGFFDENVRIRRHVSGVECLDGNIQTIVYSTYV